jgi:hypothetical protein
MVVALAAQSLGRAGDTAPGPQNALSAAAASRQQAVRTLDVRLKRVDLVRKGSVSKQWADEALSKESKATVPAEDTTLESISRLVLDGVKVRYEDRQPRWHIPTGRLDRAEALAVYDGMSPAVFYPAGTGPSDRSPTGVLPTATSKAFAFVRAPEINPITYALRGLSPALVPVSLADFKPTGAVLPIGRTRCTEYVNRGPQLSRNMWVDRAADYSVRRIQLSRRGHLETQIDIRYRQENGAGWLPSSWHVSSYGRDGTLLITTDIDVVDARVNEPVAAEEFGLRFPEGTKVFRGGDNKWYRVHADGTMHEMNPVTGEERGATVFQPGESWARRHRPLLTTGAALLVAGVVGWVVFFRRRRAARATPASSASTPRGASPSGASLDRLET